LLTTCSPGGGAGRPGGGRERGCGGKTRCFCCYQFTAKTRKNQPVILCGLPKSEKNSRLDLTCVHRCAIYNFISLYKQEIPGVPFDGRARLFLPARAVTQLREKRPPLGHTGTTSTKSTAIREEVRDRQA